MAFFCKALTLAHLSRWAAAIFFRAEADIVRLFGATATLSARPVSPFTLDHLLRWAAAIRARPAADIMPRRLFCLPYAVPNAESAAEIPRICFVNLLCSSFNSRTTSPRFVIESPHLLAKFDCLDVSTEIRTVSSTNPASPRVAQVYGKSGPRPESTSDAYRAAN